MSEDLQEELRALLDNFWILKKDNMELYYKIKRHQEELRSFIIRNLGSKLIIHDKFIKLEKFPTIPSSNLGIKGFILKTDYVFLCIILLFLEDKPEGVYFTLNSLIEYTKSTILSMNFNNVPDWKLSRDRKSFKRAIDYLIDLGVVDLKDQSKSNFDVDEDANALYVSTGLSNYVMKMFNNEIFDYTCESDFIRDEWTYQDEDKGDVRKYKVYRNILYTQVVFTSYLSESEADYLKKLRGHIHDEIMNNLSLELEVTRNMALLFDYDSKKKTSFPNNTKLSNVVLIVNGILVDKIKNNELKINNFEIGKISTDELSQIILDIKHKDSKYLSGGLKESSDEVFFLTVTDYMEELSFIKRVNDYFIVYPSVRIFVGEKRENSVNQLDLFEGVM